MKRILVVDDQSFIRELLKGQLQQLQETSIMEAANGNEAMGKAKVLKPNLILLDIVMPNKDGIEVLRELKGSPDTKDIPVIVVSSHSEQERIDEVLKLGALQFIDKANISKVNFLELANKFMS